MRRPSATTAPREFTANFEVQPSSDGQGIVWSLQFKSREQYHAFLETTADGADRAKVRELIVAGMKLHHIVGCSAREKAVTRLGNDGIAFFGVVRVDSRTRDAGGRKLGNSAPGPDVPFGRRFLSCCRLALKRAGQACKGDAVEQKRMDFPCMRPGGTCVMTHDAPRAPLHSAFTAEIKEELRVRTIQAKTGQGYREQLDRARRFLERIESTGPRRDVDYQDDVWAFFQNCWHVRDWLTMDKRVSKEVRNAIHQAVKNSTALTLCEGMANGTKHLVGLSQGKSAEHAFTETKIIPGVETTLDCMIDIGEEKYLSARALGKECVAEWERILTSHGLAVAQRS
jgi:hypothetical protein